MIRIDRLIKDAIKEDIGRGDITSIAVIPKWQTSKALMTAKEEMVVAGLHVAVFVFKTVDKKIEIRIKVKDGEKVKKGTVLMEVSGSTRSLLTAERTALNFIQRLSGI
ncbi:MAG: nicotinate-nucleotide diphosphorylase (carboxylating), partial [Deltaproteobacteria bacterium CG11_big_fil_rev_8_21_14_0_20_49_13]